MATKAAIHLSQTVLELQRIGTPHAMGWAKVLRAMVPWIEQLETEPRPETSGASYSHSARVAAILDERSNHE